MKRFLEQAQERASIRNYNDKIVDKETLDLIFDTTLKNATSNFAQQASIIRVTSQEKKDAISKISNQGFIAEATELFIFVVDNYRNLNLVKELGIDIEDRKSDVDIFFQGVTDSILMAQNCAHIVEDLGMGSVFLGSILNDAEELIKILELPKLTFPILGLAFGYFDNKPGQKPKLGKDIRVFENSYKAQDNYSKSMEKYNQTTEAYYKARPLGKDVSDFFKHVVFSISNPKDKRNMLLEIARKQGYKL